MTDDQQDNCQKLYTCDWGCLKKGGYWAVQKKCRTDDRIKIVKLIACDWGCSEGWVALTASPQLSGRVWLLAKYKISTGCLQNQNHFKHFFIQG